jgi:hypothetical protein
LAEPGPWSRISAQNSWPKTVSAAGSKPDVRRAGAAAEVDHVLHVVQGVQVGAADAAGQRLHQHLALAGSSSAISSQTSCLLRRTTALMRSTPQLLVVTGSIP